MEEGALDAAPIWTDLRTFDSRPWRGIVDGIIGGYPCQPFSCAGRRGERDDPRHLWPAIARVVGEVKPGFCFFENVSAHLTLGFEDVRRELEGMGYRVAAGLFTAAEVGASHKRERLFILAVRTGGGCGVLRKPSGGDGQPDGSSAAVDDAASGGFQDGQRVQREHEWQYAEGRAAIGGAGEIVEHAQGTDGLAGEPEEQGEPGQRRRGPGGECAELADAARVRLQQANSTADNYSAVVAFEGSGSTLFAPGPGATEAWREILSIAPTLEPAIRRVLDGMGAGLDAHRLRLAGNGVVPLQAAYALVSLAAALFSGG